MEFKHLPRQYAKLKPEIDEAVLSVLNNSVFIGGNQVAELEKELAAYVGVKHAITCANGSDALEIALTALGIGEGDAVFVPAFTYIASASCIKSVGATPIFVDVDKTTFNINTTALKEAILRTKSETELRLKAIVAVDLFGIPADYGALKGIAKAHNLQIVEDGAQSFGASLNGQKVCSFGNITTTSFFPVKPLGCYGDGGAIFTDSDELADLIKSIKGHGAKSSDKYDSVRIGRNSRLDTIQAAILSVKLKRLDDELQQAQVVAAEYERLLPKTVITPSVPKGYYSAWAQYTVRFVDKSIRNRVKEYLETQRIPTMIYYPKPLYAQGAFSSESYYDMTNTEELSNTVLSLPFSPYMTLEEVCQVCKVLETAL